MAKLNEVEKRVEAILASDPRTRSSDRHLLMVYYHLHHDISTFYKLSVTPEAPPCESITRVRRKLQAEGKYPAKPVVQEERTEQEQDHKDYSLM